MLLICSGSIHRYIISDTLSSPEVESVTMSENDELRFHELHGQNASLVHSGRTAIRPNASGEFNDAIVMSSRALRDNELFEIAIEKMVDRWSGSIEAGNVVNLSYVLMQINYVRYV